MGYCRLKAERKIWQREMKGRKAVDGVDQEWKQNCSVGNKQNENEAHLCRHSTYTGTPQTLDVKRPLTSALSANLVQLFGTVQFALPNAYGVF